VIGALESFGKLIARIMLGYADADAKLHWGAQTEIQGLLHLQLS